MPREIPGWLPIAEAAERYGIAYEPLRRMANEGFFTRGRFTSDKPGAPIYLRIDELDAWKSEGVDGVRRVQAANKAASEQDAAKTELAAAHAPDLGEAGA